MFDTPHVDLRRLIERLEDGVIIADLEGRIVSLNPAASALLGCRVAAAIGCRASEVCAGLPSLVDLCCGRCERLELAPGVAGDERQFEAYAFTLAAGSGGDNARVVVVHDVTERIRSQKALLERERTLAVLSERERLAGELHDVLGQALSHVSLQAELARSLLSEGRMAEVDSLLGRLVETAREANLDVRESMLDLRHANPGDRGLVASVQRFAGRLRDVHNIQVEMELAAGTDEGMLEPHVELQLTRILQEAMTNVRRHARASSVRLALRIEGDVAEALVEDDGRGFDMEETTRNECHSFGLGVMRDRAREIGGTLEVASTPGIGTRVVARVPVRKRAEGIGR